MEKVRNKKSIPRDTLGGGARRQAHVLGLQMMRKKLDGSISVNFGVKKRKAAEMILRVFLLWKKNFLNKQLGAAWEFFKIYPESSCRAFRCW